MENCHAELIELLDTAGPRLVGLLTRLTLREDVSEDLMQDLALKLLTNKRFWRADDRIAYACRSAIHLAMDWRRQKQRQPQTVEANDTITASTQSPLLSAIEQERFANLLAAISKLNGLQRDAVILYYVEHMPYERVADALGKKPQQARGLVSKGIRKLRTMLGTADLSQKTEVCHVSE